MSTTKITIICALIIVAIYSALFYYNKSIEFKQLNQSAQIDEQAKLQNNNEDKDMNFALAGLLEIFSKNKYVELNSYQNSCGGNMNGNSNSLMIKTIGTETVLSTSNADWYYEPPKVSEYIVDSNILKDIETIFNKYHMNKWMNIKFSNIFVDDGETCSYRFIFKDHEIVHFSSQIFSEKYSSKLKEIDEVISSYIKKGKKLPGLVQHKLSSEESQNLYFNCSSGTKDLIIRSYIQNELQIMLVNGTPEEITFPLEFSAKIYQGDKIEFETKISTKYERTINAESQTEKTIKIDHHLDVGTYKLEYGPFSTTFEIK